MEKNSVLIIKETAGSWTLRIATNVGTSEEFVQRMVFKKLVDALQAACLLKLRVDNADRLPINQYYKAA